MSSAIDQDFLVFFNPNTTEDADDYSEIFDDTGPLFTFAAFAEAVKDELVSVRTCCCLLITICSYFAWIRFGWKLRLHIFIPCIIFTIAMFLLGGMTIGGIAIIIDCVYILFGT